MIKLLICIVYYSTFTVLLWNSNKCKSKSKKGFDIQMGVRFEGLPIIISSDIR